MGLAFLYYTLLKSSEAHGWDKSVWKMTLGALCIWFVFDSVTSFATGFQINHLSNLILLGWFVLPLWKSGLLAID